MWDSGASVKVAPSGSNRVKADFFLQIHESL